MAWTFCAQSEFALNLYTLALLVSLAASPLVEHGDERQAAPLLTEQVPTQQSVTQVPSRHRMVRAEDVQTALATATLREEAILAAIATKESEVATVREKAPSRAFEGPPSPNQVREDASSLERSTQELQNLRGQLIGIRTELAHLKRVKAVLDRLGNPALRALMDLRQPDASRGPRIAMLQDIAGSVTALRARVASLTTAAESGRLIGFRGEIVAIEELALIIETKLSSFQTDLVALVDELKAILQGEQQRGSLILDRFFEIAVMDAPQSHWDNAFTDHLRQERRLRPMLSERRVPRFAPDALREKLSALLIAPESIGTLDDAKARLDEVYDILPDVAGYVANEQSTPQLWIHAFEKQCLTLFVGLASKESVAKAYQISAEIVDDLLVQSRVLRDTLEGWRERRTQELTSFFSGSLRGDRAALLGRWLLGLLIVILGVRYRRMSVKLVDQSITALARQKWLRGRVGTLVRWGTVAHAVGPTLTVVVTMAVAFSLFGRDTPEVDLAWRALIWFGTYALGYRFLRGLTTPVSRGRPALLGTSAEHTVLLLRTYRNFGAVFASAFFLDDLLRRSIGAGPVQTLMETGLRFGVLVWALWAMVRWRTAMADWWTNTGNPTAYERRLAEWMKASRWGFVLVPVAGLLCTVKLLARTVELVLQRGGILAFVRARYLRTLSQRSGADLKKDESVLPADYVSAFPLYPVLGEDSALLLPRDDLCDVVTHQVGQWKESQQDGSLALVGGKGMGKTTFLCVLEQKLASFDVVHHTWKQKAADADDVLEELNTALSLSASSINELIQQINGGPERILFVDEAHDVFLRSIDGYRAFDALTHVVNSTCEHVFWVAAFNEFAWQFIHESRKRTQYFRGVLRLPEWKAGDLQDLIGRRNRQAGYEVVFDEAIADPQNEEEQGFRLIEGGESYFRLLAEVSGGNPRVAIYHWLRSLTVSGDRELTVRLTAMPNLAPDSLTDDMVFALASVCQHENLGVKHLQRTLRMSAETAMFTMRFLRARGVIERKHNKPDRYTLSPRFYRGVLRLLRQKHLLFEST